MLYLIHHTGSNRKNFFIRICSSLTLSGGIKLFSVLIYKIFGSLRSSFRFEAYVQFTFFLNNLEYSQVIDSFITDFVPCPWAQNIAYISELNSYLILWYFMLYNMIAPISRKFYIMKPHLYDTWVWAFLLLTSHLTCDGFAYITLGRSFHIRVLIN